MKTFPLQIVTPEGNFFDGEAQMIRLRTVDGDVAILADHMQYATAIGMGECRIVLPDDTERRAACCGGLLVAAGQVRVVAATFAPALTSASAVARPNPEAPPVTIATFPSICI